MKKISTFAVVFAALTFASCSKEKVLNADESKLSNSEVSMIEAAGLRATGATRESDGYLIEGDILVTADELRAMSSNQGPELIVANSEQYRTYYLVRYLPRVIKIKYTGTRASVSTALTNAVARYNALGLRITLQKITSGTPNITISDVSGVSYIASAGFPTSTGEPHNSIKFNTTYSGWASNTLTSVVAHEIGHCIGFRHTDYMNRQYSCGGNYYNEGQAGVGAYHIPGTPTGPDPNSWMLACISNGVNRPFNYNDKVALNYLY